MVYMYNPALGPEYDHVLCHMIHSSVMPMMAAYLQVFTVGLLITVFFSTAHGTALDDYVNKYDPTYTYTEIGTPFKGDGFTSYFINMTSQTWLSGT